MKKDLEYYRKNAEEDYLITPISVLRYIAEMEQTLRIHDAVVRSEQSVCDICGGGGFRWSPYYAKEVVCDCKR